MRRARLYVGYTLGFWATVLSQQNAINTHAPKTLGECFPPFAGACRIAPAFTPARQTPKRTTRLFASVRQCSRTVGYRLATRAVQL